MPTSPFRRTPDRKKKESENIRSSRNVRASMNESEDNITSSIPTDHRYATENAPDWVKDLGPSLFSVEKQSAAFDDHISVASTPPDKKSNNIHVNKRDVQPTSTTSVIDFINAKRLSKRDAVTTWLSDLGFDVNLSNKKHAHVMASSDNEVDMNIYTTDFSDGILLRNIIKRLDRNMELKGFNINPKTNAQKLQNIRKILEFLSYNKKIPLSILKCEMDILNGVTDIIVNLLLKIRDVYKIHSKIS
jgi:hypothetical protein